MQIAKDTVVTVNYELKEQEGKVIEKAGSMLTYLHGGYDGIFPLVEEALHGKTVGDECVVLLEPDDAFGEHDETLVRVEPRKVFPKMWRWECSSEGGGKMNPMKTMCSTP
jgi:FKBP-type peptidyl-prolyl cis-trans isomerase SlyD